MFESFVTLLPNNWQLFAEYYIELAILMYVVCYIIEVVLGLPIHGPIPSTMTHAELRKFIQTICEEVMNIPHALDFSGVPGRLEEPMSCFDPKKYEQLLATAVINKISDFYQNEKNLPFDLESETYAAVELDGNHNQVNGNAVDMMAERHQIKQLSSPTMERLNSKAVDDESHLCDYVQNHYVPLPDLSTDSANEDVDVQSIGGSSNGTDATWEDNWLFRTRKLKTENQSIAMLVPSPTEEIKALIGDTNADETSDLSENSDDDEVYDYEIGHSLKTTTLYTNTVLIKTESHPEHMKKGHDEVSIKKATSPDSLTSMQSLTSMDTGSPLITEAKNNLLLMHDDDFAMSLPVSQNGTLLFEMSENRAEFPIEETILNVSNFNIGGSVSEKISALTVLIDKAMDDEEFDSIVSPSQLRDHKKSIDEQFEKLLMDDNNNAEILLPDVVQQPFSEVFIEQVEIIKEEDEKLVDEPTPTQAAQVPSQPDLVPEKRTSIDDPETVLMDAIVPGSFAEREHLKWLHAAPIARNPYSAEVLQRRLSDRENYHTSKVLSLSNHQLVDILVEESAQGHDTSKDNEDDEDVVKPKKVDMKKYKRDYYINDPTEVTKRYSPSFVTTPATTHTSKSNSLDLDDDVSDVDIYRKFHNHQHHQDRQFLMEKFLNSPQNAFDSLSHSSRSTRTSPDSDVPVIPNETLKQLESKMLHNDLMRERFRARAGTNNFCLNPLFEEKIADDVTARTSRSVPRESQTLPRKSSSSSFSSNDNLKSNCVESIFMNLNKIRRSGSLRSIDSDRSSCVAERCHTMKCNERKLK